MQRFILVVPFFIGLIIGFSSCIDLVTDEFPSADPSLVVNGLLIAGKNISIHISESDGLDTSFLHPISEASVVLYEDDVNVGMLEHDANGFFSIDEIAKQGSRYRFNILVDGYEPIVVEDKVPMGVDTVGLEIIRDYGIDYDGVLYPALNLKIPNNPEQDLYFEVLIFLEYPSGTEPAMWQRFEDTLLTREGLPISVFSNKDVHADSINIFIPFFTSTSNTIRFTLYPFTVQVRSLSHESFQFAKKRYLYDLSRYPHVVIGAAPAINLHSNVQKGLGFVGGMAIYETELITP